MTGEIRWITQGKWRVEISARYNEIWRDCLKSPSPDCRPGLIQWRKTRRREIALFLSRSSSMKKRLRVGEVETSEKGSNYTWVKLSGLSDLFFINPPPPSSVPSWIVLAPSGDIWIYSKWPDVRYVAGHAMKLKETVRGQSDTGQHPQSASAERKDGDDDVRLDTLSFRVDILWRQRDHPRIVFFFYQNV